MISVRSAPSQKLLQRLTEELQQLDAIDTSDSPADVVAQVNAVTDAIQKELDESGLTYPTPTPTATSKPTPSATATPTSTATPTATPSSTATPAPTSTPTVTPTPTATATATPTATATARPTATAASTP